VRKADNLPPSCAIVTKSGSLNFLEHSGPLQACNWTALTFYLLSWGTAVKVLRYKSEGPWFDSGWCHWNFSLTSFRSHYGPGVDKASNRHEYRDYFLGVNAAGA